jgi:hypothetical protein
MSKLILVHGTFATGPETGERWWQKESVFEKEMRLYLRSERGELEFDRIVWDGQNTESARRLAALDINRALAACEAAEGRNEVPCCIIGHSHGGSAIAAALLSAAGNGYHYNSLKRWITVASPFICLSRSRLLFSRLRQMGKAAYLVMVIWAALALLASITQFYSGDPLIAIAFIVLFAVMPVAVAYAAMLFVTARRFRQFNPKWLSAFDERFGGRWLGLWHQDDEAIGGLRSLARTDVPLFGSRFAVPIISALAIYVMPVALLIALSSSELMHEVLRYGIGRFGFAPYENIAEGYTLIGDGHNWGINFNLLATTAYEEFKAFVPLDGAILAPLFLVIVVPLAMFAVSLVIVAAMAALAGLISRGISILLNGLAMQQIRQFALGGNVVGESATGAEPFPVALKQRFPPLPDELAALITATSDDAAAKAIGKFRSMIGLFAFAPQPLDPLSLVDKFSWNELIHTTYFDVPEFRLLLAYCVSQCEGFSASDKLRTHPDLERVQIWYNAVAVPPPKPAG